MLEGVPVGIGSVLGIFGNVGTKFPYLAVVRFVDDVTLVSLVRLICKGPVSGPYGLICVPKISILAIIALAYGDFGNDFGIWDCYTYSRTILSSFKWLLVKHAQGVSRTLARYWECG